MPITDEDKWREASREVAMRRSVYPGLLAAGKMSPNDARRRIAVMEAIAFDYREKFAPGLKL